MLIKTTLKKAIVVNSMVFFLFASICVAQTNIPSAVNFQAIARDGLGALVTNSQIEVQLTILDGGPAGTPLRQPRFIRNTDAFGQFNLTMSEDSATGFGPSGVTLIPNIDWSTGNKWVRIEFRPNLIAPFTNLGTVKCNSDFYAFAARTAEVLKTPGVAGQVLKHNGTDWVAGTDNTGSSPIAPTIQKFNSGSGTYTTPLGVLYIEIEMVGGGGGGGGSCSGLGCDVITPGTAGGATNFGIGLLTASGGGAGAAQADGGLGGNSTIAVGPVGIAIKGSGGGSGGTNGSASPGVQFGGGIGGASTFGGSGFGGGGGGGAGSPGGNAAPNSGSGGGGASGPNLVFAVPGSGGGSGGYVKAIITSPLSSYSYAVGAGGTGGLAGANGSAGGNGASGVIIVKEYYQ